MLFRHDINIDLLIDDLLNKIPQPVWKSSTTTFLDPAAGGGQFLNRIVTKLRLYGHSDANIRRRVVGVFETLIARNYATRMGVMGTLICDILEVNYMNFDVTCSNPPYQDGTGKSSNKLWKQIVEDSLKRLSPGGYMAFVTPPSWMSPGSLYDDLMVYDMQWVNLDVKKHFSVGSDFSAWVLRKQAPKGTTKFVTPTETLTVEHDEFPFLPSRIDKHSLSITKKLLVGPRFDSFIKNNENHSTKANHLSKTKDTTHKWIVRHTNVQDRWSNKKPAEYDVPKVMLTESGNPIPVYSDACGVSEHMFYIKVKNATEGKRLVKVLSSKLYQVLLKDSNGVKGMWKYSGWNQLAIVRSLPAVDRSIDWTDEMLYEHFKLTKDEIAYVEQYAK